MDFIAITKDVQKIFNNIFENIQNKPKIYSSHVDYLKKKCGSCKMCKEMKGLPQRGITKHKLCGMQKCESKTLKNIYKRNGKSPEFCSLSEFIPGTKFYYDGDRILYEKAIINGITYKKGDFLFCTDFSDAAPIILRLEYIFIDTSKPSEILFHGSAYCRTEDTILGSEVTSRAIYLLDTCYDKCPMQSILSKANVIVIHGNENFNTEIPEECLYTSKYYDKHTSSFKDLPASNAFYDMNKVVCFNCQRKKAKYFELLPCHGKKMSSEQKKSDQYESIYYKGEIIKIGSGILIYPNSKHTNFYKKISDKIILSPDEKIKKYDKKIYTEIHKYTPCEQTVVKPFKIGIVKEIIRDNYLSVIIEIFVVKRAEEIDLPNIKRDFNKVYVTEQIERVSLTETAGLCYVLYKGQIPISVDEWTKLNNKNFYYDKCYKDSTNIEEVPRWIIEFSIKCRDTKNHLNDEVFKECDTQRITVAKDLRNQLNGYSESEMTDMQNPKQSNLSPLKMMDIFAGCGGLSKGLEESGAAISYWAVDSSEAACKSYKANFPQCTVFNEDCNKFLRKAMNNLGKTNGKRIPRPGEVDIICGGPPCQGWTGLNRFSKSDMAKYQNSLVATFLSFCDYYKPKYIIFENVKRLCAAKKGNVIKLTLKCLLEIDYQCTAMLVECGAYGVPQKRKRVIIFGAAPGMRLPEFPKPTHSFDFSFEEIFQENDFVTYSKNLISGPAPKRTVTLADAIGDLPQINSDASLTPIPFRNTPKNDFQESTRSSNLLIHDHICKPLSSISLMRIKYIPKDIKEADWRFLPNIAIKLPNGQKLKKLKYTHKRGNMTDNNKGVCSCLLGEECDPQFKQKSTLIPWGYVHTSSRHANWPGVYGRLHWNGISNTLLCDPDPSRMHGRVIHPTQDRVLSVREYARIQGFPDSFIFCGTIEEKFRQIGNSVPVPLARAIGLEIILSQRKKDSQMSNQLLPIWL